MQFIGEDKYKWQYSQSRIKKLRNAEEVARQYAQEVRQDKWDKWTERILRWLIIISIIMIYNLFIGAIAIHIYQ